MNISKSGRFRQRTPSNQNAPSPRLLNQAPQKRAAPIFQQQPPGENRGAVQSSKRGLQQLFEIRPPGLSINGGRKHSALSPARGGPSNNGPEASGGRLRRFARFERAAAPQRGNTGRKRRGGESRITALFFSNNPFLGARILRVY
ncbi:MAG: hypothetical protein LBC53_09725 [Spirochaetaceae bacterium]|jgi:hypothetical protein|nr:hypothetical protein [Spirochaetaceae bacterium]